MAILTTTLHRVFLRRDREFLNRLRLLVEQEYEDPNFGLARLAEEMEISRRQIQRKLRNLEACTPSEYLRKHRLQRALAYLRSGEPIGETACKVGFTSQSYFTSCFKARYGLTPSKFQNSVEKSVKSVDTHYFKY